MFPTEHDREVKRWLSDSGDEKLRYDYELNRDSLVIDVGGYKGQWASDIYARYNCRIMVFEPVNQFADKIEKRFKRNTKIEVFCFALGKKRRQELIAVSDDGSSVYRNSAEKSETIQFEDVSEFFDRRDIMHVDLMKINVEGGEYELLPRLFEKDLISRINYIQIQFHNIGPDSNAQMETICRELLKTHRPTYQYKFVWENWVRLDSEIDGGEG